MNDFLIIGAIVLILGFAVGYVIKAKKRGKKCIGCPYSSCGSCSGGENCSCHNH